MAHRTLAVLYVVLVAGSAVANEEASRPRIRTPKHVADAVIAAVEDHDEAGLKALAARDEPDPWLVADELCRQGQYDAAQDFAGATRGTATKQLHAYVHARRGTGAEREAYEVLVAMSEAIASSAWQRALSISDSQSGELSSVLRIVVAFNRGLALRHVGRLDQSGEALRGVGEAARALGWLTRAATAFHESGVSDYYMSDRKRAVSAWEARLQIERALERVPEVAAALNNLGIAHSLLGSHEEALRAYEQALEIERSLGRTEGVARTLANLGLVQTELEDYEAAIGSLQEALGMLRNAGNAAGAALVTCNIGNVHRNVGDDREALRHYMRSLEAYQSLGHQAGVATALNNIGLARHRLGDYPQALNCFQDALKSFRELEDLPAVASALNNLGLILSSLGDYAETLRLYEEALAIRRKLANPTDIVVALNNVGSAMDYIGDHDSALRTYEEALEIARSTSDTRGVALLLSNTANAQGHAGNLTGAIASYEEALRIRRSLGDAAGIAQNLMNLAALREQRRDVPAAKAALLEAEKLLAGEPEPDLQARLKWGIARVHLREKKPDEALEVVRQGIELVSRLTHGLAEGEGGGARDVFAGFFGVGYQAALRAGDADSLLWLFEHGRAGTLRESLGSRTELEAAVLSKRLLKDLALARSTEQGALEAYRVARDHESPEATRVARAAWEAARDRVRQVLGRIEREEKQLAAITFSDPDAGEVIKAHLAPEEALIYYGLTDDEAMALIVDRKDVRVVALGASADVTGSAGDLLKLVQSSTRGSASAAKAGSEEGANDIETLRATLERQLVAPLELGSHVKRVLVSPMGVLGYVPFAMLFPEREVSYTPSGTTHGLLVKERSKRGQAILALGDPAYEISVSRSALQVHRGGSLQQLPRLPGTREEVGKIADLALLQDKATEAGLRTALKKRPRWRSVHLACHGLIDPERPRLSALALTADPTNDGFLTALEIFRMTIPADLVVLSACETARGKVYQTEGIVGMSRAFMYAGAPRVICSLWKVDDGATRALMTRFYELWNPRDGTQGISASAALKRAQEHVRTFQREVVDEEASAAQGRTVRKMTRPWQHPSFWAAWVLWGLSD